MAKCKYGFTAGACELGIPGCACADDWFERWGKAGYPSDTEGNPLEESEWPALQPPREEEQ